MKKIAIIDHGYANIGSLSNILEALGQNVLLINEYEEPEEDLVGFILPGVGSFGPAMRNLRQRGLDKYIYKCMQKDILGMGICLGMQMLAQSSEEDTNQEKGLALFPGKIHKLDQKNDLVPNMGWCKTSQKHEWGKNSKNILNGTYYYVHSYVYDSDDASSVVATCMHGEKEIVSSIYRKGLLGVQFHPEKSQHHGIKLLNSFFDLGQIN